MKGFETYDDWKQCITVACEIPLTLDFVETRLAALRNRSDMHTRKFIEQWGEPHLKRVIGWFEQAQRELG